MSDANNRNFGDPGYDASTEGAIAKNPFGQWQGIGDGGNKSGVAFPNQPQGSAAPGAQSVDEFFGGASKSLSGQHQSGQGTGFGNAVADASRFTQDRWGDIMGTRNPNDIRVGQQGQNAMNRGDHAAGQTRNMQMSLIQQLQDQANGVGPSLAQMQLQKGTDQNLSNAMALGQSQRGAGAAGMMKGIQTQQAGIAQGMAGDSAMLRLQEQMAARNQLGQSLGQVRGSDDQNAQFYAGQQNTTANSNAQRQADAAKQQATLDLEREKMLNEQRKNNSPLGFMGGLFSSMSDERVKTDIAPASSSLYEFLDKLGAHEYRYKDEKHGEGRRVSPMAQELESSEAGKPFVFETKDGKAVDYGKGFGTMLASQAELHRRLKKLEGS